MLRVSPQKLNLVAQLIRGKKVAAALADLEFSRKRIARDVKKCLESAIANAENNHDLDVDDLVVKEAFVGKALVMKRFHARARGRGARILKPFSNLTIVVREKSRTGLRSKEWVIKSTRSASGWVSIAPGIRAGSPPKGEYCPPACTKTWPSVRLCASNSSRLPCRASSSSVRTRSAA